MRMQRDLMNYQKHAQKINAMHHSLNPVYRVAIPLGKTYKESAVPM